MAHRQTGRYPLSPATVHGLLAIFHTSTPTGSTTGWACHFITHRLTGDLRISIRARYPGHALPAGLRGSTPIPHPLSSDPMRDDCCSPLTLAWHRLIVCPCIQGMKKAHRRTPKHSLPVDLANARLVAHHDADGWNAIRHWRVIPPFYLATIAAVGRFFIATRQLLRLLHPVPPLVTDCCLVVDQPICACQPGFRVPSALPHLLLCWGCQATPAPHPEMGPCCVSPWPTAGPVSPLIQCLMDSDRQQD